MNKNLKDKPKTALFKLIKKDKFLSNIKQDLNKTWLKNMGFRFTQDQWEYLQGKLG